MSGDCEACLLHYWSNIRAVFRDSKRFGSTQRFLTPAQTESAVYILKEENQTPKREINLSLTEAINRIQMWQRMKPLAMC